MQNIVVESFFFFAQEMAEECLNNVEAENTYF